MFDHGDALKEQLGRCSDGKVSAYNAQYLQELWVQSLGQDNPLEKEMATHSCILAWEIPSTEEPGGLQSMELQKSWT